MRFFALPLLLLSLVIAAHGAGVEGVWHFDDLPVICDNPSIQDGSLWALPLQPRGLAFVSYRINYLLGGYDVVGFHVFNIGIHAIATVALWGVLECLFNKPEKQSAVRRKSSWLPLVAAMIWGVHPLTTQSVAYIVQRMESMWSAAFLIGLYLFLRTIKGAGTCQESRSFRLLAWPKWQELLSIVCFWLGMISKEAIVPALFTLPIFDYVLDGKSLRSGLIKRGSFYALLGIPLVIGVPFVLVPSLLDSSSTASAGLFVVSMSPMEYWQSQPEALLLYAGKVMWPFRLCFDYLWPPQSNIVVLVVQWSIFVVAMVGAVLGTMRRRLWGLLGLMYFITLSTTSMVPLVDTVVEHRAYLASAWLIALTLLVLQSIAAKIATILSRKEIQDPELFLKPLVVCVTIAVVTGLSWLTCKRSLAYLSEQTLWSDTIEKSPGNYRAYVNLANAYLSCGEPQKAVPLVQLALTLPMLDRFPLHQKAKVHDVLAIAYSAAGDLENAVQEAQKAIALTPGGSDHLLRLASIYAEHGRWSDATKVLNQAIANRPRRAELYEALGKVYVASKSWNRAKMAYLKFAELTGGLKKSDAARKLLYLEWLLGNQDAAARVLSNILPVADREEAWGELADMLASAERWDEYKVVAVRAGKGYRPSMAPDENRLKYYDFRETGDLVNARTFVEKQLTVSQGKEKEFWVLEYAQLHSLLSDHEKALLILDSFELREIGGEANLARGDILRRKGDFDGAKQEYALAIDNGMEDPYLFNNLGSLLSRQDPAAAVSYFQRALDLQPENYQAWHNLGNAYLRIQDVDKAASCFERALKINPEFEASRSTLSMIRKGIGGK